MRFIIWDVFPVARTSRLLAHLHLKSCTIKDVSMSGIEDFAACCSVPAETKEEVRIGHYFLFEAGGTLRSHRERMQVILSSPKLPLDAHKQPLCQSLVS
jgi:hypothetical protein